MSKRQKIEVALVGNYWMRVDADKITEERVLPGNLPLVELHPQFVRKTGQFLVWSIDEPSAGERRYALKTGVMVIIEIIDPTASELFPRSNPMAAEYAGGYALGKWFPDISEITRERLREIIQRAFGSGTPQESVVAAIRAAGILSESRAKLVVQDEIAHTPAKRNFEAWERMATEYASKHAREWWPDISEPTRTKIKQIIFKAYKKEVPYSKIDWTIRDVDIFGEAWANLIAQTEIAQAQIGANWETWKKSGVVGKIKWLAVGRDPCPVCEKNDGVARTFGQEFPSGEVRPLAHPLCQCILTPVFD